MGQSWWEAIGELISQTAGVAGGLAIDMDGLLVEIGEVGAESVTFAHDEGVAILADLNGDGLVDHATMHSFSGSYEVWSAVIGECDWSLSTGATEKSSNDWGLTSDSDPEIGWSGLRAEQSKTMWKCVDRG